MISDSVYNLLELYLSQREGAAPLEFEDWAASYPDRAPALRKAWQDWQRASAELEASPRASSARAANRPGQKIAGFELVQRLGSGGQASVWEAHQEKLGRQVALKLLRPDRVSARDRALFQREARAGAQLRHEGIVSVYDSGEEGDVCWIAQELIPGGRTLRDRIDEVRRAGTSPSDWYVQVADLTRRIASALHVAHQAGIVHRDIKPQNILLTAEGLPKVSDFGLARVEDTSAMSQSGQLVGTYLYMSPEQVTADRAQIDHRTDIFSLGVVFYELLTLARPFEGDTPHQICSRIVLSDPPEPQRVRSRVPRDLSVICCKALEKDRDRRYSDMQALAEDLTRFHSHRPILAKPPTPLDRTGKWIRRHPTKSVAAAMATVALGAIALLGVRLSDSKDEALRKTADVFRLSLSQNYANLKAEAEQLWPAHPDKLDAMRNWVARAEGLVAEIPTLVATRDELRAAALPLPTGQQESWTFPDEQASWWHGQVMQLIGNLESLTAAGEGLLVAEGETVEHGWNMARRIASAEHLRAGFAQGAEYDRAWQAALPSIREIYPDLGLVPLMGLVPLDRDPTSGLWEFWHVLSGERPRRDPETGRLIMGAETGIVLTLLVGGAFWMGSQKEHPQGRNYDPLSSKSEPVQEILLTPFLISKYEVTRRQWLRVSPAPDLFQEHARTKIGAGNMPLTNCSWREAAQMVRRLGLSLPTEAQWEYAARAGTAWPWWCGRDRESIARAHAGNLADGFALACKTNSYQARKFESWDDGVELLAPIGAYAPNPFGIHDTIGNALEWCADVFDPDCGAPVRAGDALRLVEPRGDAPHRTHRGGNFYYTADVARVSARSDHGIDYRDGSLGVRPALMLRP